MMRGRPILLRYVLHKLLFRIQHVLCVRKANSVGNAEHMRIHGYCRHAERIGYDYVRRLSPNAGQLCQLVTPARDLSAVLLNYYFTGSDYVFALCLVKAAASYIRASSSSLKDANASGVL